MSQVIRKLDSAAGLHSYQNVGCNNKLFGTGQEDSNDNLSGKSRKNIESFKVNC